MRGGRGRSRGQSSREPIRTLRVLMTTQAPQGESRALSRHHEMPESSQTTRACAHLAAGASVVVSISDLQARLNDQITLSK
ncbi:hypothetical protein BN903_20 [Halorubrum sp. AJ67]|nr:hypothetical protein BN903_20 [Halorubrum sp. AJ67]